MGSHRNLIVLIIVVGCVIAAIVAMANYEGDRMERATEAMRSSDSTTAPVTTP